MIITGNLYTTSFLNFKVHQSRGRIDFEVTGVVDAFLLDTLHTQYVKNALETKLDPTRSFKDLSKYLASPLDTLPDDLTLRLNALNQIQNRIFRNLDEYLRKNNGCTFLNGICDAGMDQDERQVLSFFKQTFDGLCADKQFVKAVELIPNIVHFFPDKHDFSEIYLQAVQELLSQKEIVKAINMSSKLKSSLVDKIIQEALAPLELEALSDMIDRDLIVDEAKFHIVIAVARKGDLKEARSLRRTIKTNDQDKIYKVFVEEFLKKKDGESLKNALWAAKGINHHKNHYVEKVVGRAMELNKDPEYEFVKELILPLDNENETKYLHKIYALQEANDPVAALRTALYYHDPVLLNKSIDYRLSTKESTTAWNLVQHLKDPKDKDKAYFKICEWAEANNDAHAMKISFEEIKDTNLKHLAGKLMPRP